MAKLLTVQDHIQNSTGLTFKPGRSDCGLWVADYVLGRTGVDVAAHLRGTYRTREGFEEIARKAGGFKELFESLMVDFDKTDYVQSGDPCVVASADGPTAAICSVSGVVWMSTNGVAWINQARILSAWRLP